MEAYARAVGLEYRRVNRAGAAARSAQEQFTLRLLHVDIGCLPMADDRAARHYLAQRILTKIESTEKTPRQTSGIIQLLNRLTVEPERVADIWLLLEIK